MGNYDVFSGLLLTLAILLALALIAWIVHRRQSERNRQQAYMASSGTSPMASPPVSSPPQSAAQRPQAPQQPRPAPATEPIGHLHPATEVLRRSQDWFLNLAAPETVAVEIPFELAVMISHSWAVSLLTEEMRKQEWEGLEIVWPDDFNSVDLRVHLSAAGCRILSQPFQLIRLRAATHSPKVFFQLVPLHQGDLAVRVTVYQSLLTLGSARLKLFSTDRVAGGSYWDLGIVPPDSTIADNHLSMVLDRAFSLAELRSLALEIGVDTENLVGETKQMLAHELVRYCRRRGSAGQLVDRVLAHRPNWLELAY